MIPVKSMTEEEIDGVAEAFADYSYTDGEHGLVYLFPKRETLIAYLKVVVRAGLKAGMVYTNGPNREGFIIITDTTKPMPLGPMLMMFRGMIRALGLKGFQNFTKHCQSGGVTNKTIETPNTIFSVILFKFLCLPYFFVVLFSFASN